ncbi:MAG TPA: 16S rRNA (cytosine(1402)-N(4))-methyltransferase RsmH [bacterium]|nr:16S rRNA (cytosine(1402)-N(4))-methyltransferase RsmH [bacterium]
MSAGVATPASAFRHDPVLLAEVLSYVPPQPHLLVDATVGGAGHAQALLERFPDAELFACDRDPDAVTAARERLAPHAGRVLVKQLPFSALPHHLLAGSVSFLLADLGVSSHQLETGPRGFSFTEDGPLDMRMDPAAGEPAAALVNHARPEDLVDLLRRFGEERFAPRIVQAIVAARSEAPIETTGQLARLAAHAVPAKFHRRGFHPATRVFQALRIAVNDELGELERLLDVAPPLLAPGGRLAIISFHSLEDRLVKDRFRDWEQPCTCPPSMPICVCGKVPLGRRVMRKPVGPSSAEAARNPRSRSAKLRVFEKAADAGADADAPGGRAAS